MKIPIQNNILNANDEVAEENRRFFNQHGILVVNIMASPGAGKTSLILATLSRLPHNIRPAVIEGDLASSIDADTIAAHGYPVTQINTGGNCHLDAPQIRTAMVKLPFDSINLLLIENVGNLVCPAGFDLGADLAVVIGSVPEGHDKPYKYPGMFAAANALVLNKSDMIEVFEFDVEYYLRGVRMVNPDIPFFQVSCKRGEGLENWIEWLLGHCLNKTRRL